MEATVQAPSAQTGKDYTSRPSALSRFFRMSRNGWKSKYKLSVFGIFVQVRANSDQARGSRLRHESGTQLGL